MTVRQDDATAGTDSAPWLEAVETLRPVPERYFAPTLDVAEAARQLGCVTDVVEELVRAGLQSTDSADGPLLDYHDVMNVGMAARTGRSLPEQAERRCMRMAAGDPRKWIEPRTWRVRLGAPCTEPGCAGAVPTPPAPGLLGGELLEYQPSDAAAHEADAVVITRGNLDEPRTRAVREVYDEVLSGLTTDTYRYSWLPHALRAEPAKAAELGMVDCVIAAWIMQQHAEAAGLEARTRKGYLIGLVGVEHAWTEVLEEGRWLPLDPILAFLALRQPGSDPGFTDFCRGSAHQRLLAWDRRADEPITDHACERGGRIAYRCSQLPGAAPAPRAAAPGSSN